jgi:hypothetical protein
MKIAKLLLLLPLALASACTSTPVRLGTGSDAPPPQGSVREIASEACGFQLFVLIPISVNARQERAYTDLQAQAAGDVITDVEVEEHWFYAFVGTGYCTSMRAKAIKRS